MIEAKNSPIKEGMNYVPDIQSTEYWFSSPEPELYIIQCEEYFEDYDYKIISVDKLYGLREGNNFFYKYELNPPFNMDPIINTKIEKGIVITQKKQHLPLAIWPYNGNFNSSELSSSVYTDAEGNQWIDESGLLSLTGYTGDERFFEMINQSGQKNYDPSISKYSGELDLLPAISAYKDFGPGTIGEVDRNGVIFNDNKSRVINIGWSQLLQSLQIPAWQNTSYRMAYWYPCYYENAMNFYLYNLANSSFTTGGYRKTNCNDTGFFYYNRKGILKYLPAEYVNRQTLESEKNLIRRDNKYGNYKNEITEKLIINTGFDKEEEDIQDVLSAPFTIGAPCSSIITDCSPSVSLCTLLAPFTLFFSGPAHSVVDHSEHCSNTDMVVVCE